jgi:hypothetical protein
MEHLTKEIFRIHSKMDKAPSKEKMSQFIQGSFAKTKLKDLESAFGLMVIHSMVIGSKTSCTAMENSLGLMAESILACMKTTKRADKERWSGLMEGNTLVDGHMVNNTVKELLLTSWVPLRKETIEVVKNL